MLLDAPVPIDSGFGSRYGAAEVSPREKTNEPTPMSIYPGRTAKGKREYSIRVRYQSHNWRVHRAEVRTDQAGPPIFALSELSREHGEIHSEDGDDGHHHHL